MPQFEKDISIVEDDITCNFDKHFSRFAPGIFFKSDKVLPPKELGLSSFAISELAILATWWPSFSVDNWKEVRKKVLMALLNDEFDFQDRIYQFYLFLQELGTPNFEFKLPLYDINPELYKKLPFDSFSNSSFGYITYFFQTFGWPESSAINLEEYPGLETSFKSTPSAREVWLENFMISERGLLKQKPGQLYKLASIVFAVPKKDSWRMVINNRINKLKIKNFLLGMELSWNLPTVESIAKFLQANKDVKSMRKHDLKQSFRFVNLDPFWLGFNAVVFRGSLWWNIMASMGDTESAARLMICMTAMCIRTLDLDYLQNGQNLSILYLSEYMDDQMELLKYASSDFFAQSVSEAGFELNVDKTQMSSDYLADSGQVRGGISFLGWFFDLERRVRYLSDKRFSKLVKWFRQLQTEMAWDLHTCQRVHGNLVSCAVAGCQFLNRWRDIMRKAKDFHPNAFWRISVEDKKALLWDFLMIFQQLESQHFAKYYEPYQMIAVLASDATPSRLAAYVSKNLNPEPENAYIYFELDHNLGTPVHIPEFIAAALNVIVFIEHCKLHSVKLHLLCDNKSAVHCFNLRNANDLKLQAAIRALSWFLIKRNVTVSAAWLPTGDNKTADEGSRMTAKSDRKYNAVGTPGVETMFEVFMTMYDFFLGKIWFPPNEGKNFKRKARRVEAGVCGQYSQEVVQLDEDDIRENAEGKKRELVGVSRVGRRHFTENFHDLFSEGNYSSYYFRYVDFEHQVAEERNFFKNIQIASSKNVVKKAGTTEKNN